MKEKFYTKFASAVVVMLFITAIVHAQVVPTITGPAGPGMLETIGDGYTPAVYSTETGQSGYVWIVSGAGAITGGQGTESITVDWINPPGVQFVSVSYTGSATATLVINYFPFAPPIDPTTIPQFVDPLPHFAAGLRVDATAGGNLTVRTQVVQQIALPTGMTVANGTIGDPLTPDAGKGNYAAYSISKDGGTFGPAMWPAQTIEALQGNGLVINWQNGLSGVTYNHFNILADQTLLMNGHTLTGDPMTEPYKGEIPMVAHLHGGEIPSDSDGGPNAWFTASGKLGPAFKHFASSATTYPNMQEETTLWYHPHDDGLTRINVYTGLAGFYLLRGAVEEAAKLPGWSGDDLVREVTPADLIPNPTDPNAAPFPRAATFNGLNTYLPEIEIAIQDRMFDINGQLHWPVAPPNPELHPFWTPEFVGDVMTVNGKTWPYLSVAPRKYRFRLLDGCNARWLNLWLVDAADETILGPPITVVGGDGGLLASPVTIDPAAGGLLIGPGQRYDIVIDFTNYAGRKFILKNDAGTPYPFGDPVVPGLTDRIMQFVVNGEMVSAANQANPGNDNSQLPQVLRPLVTLTDFNGNLAAGVTPKLTRQIILNEVMATGGPAAVQVNNMYFETALAVPGSPFQSGGPTEFMEEGTTEVIQIANVSADAHPMHIHLLQWQLVSRQPIDDIRYLDDYAIAWANNNPNNYPNFPLGMPYPGGAGPPFDYNVPNADLALGGNPAFTPYLLGTPQPALPEERGWKDNTTVMPGMVSTFVVRVAPTDQPIDATPAQLLLPFDPSLGPGYVWHCHIIDHEDMSMMRPLVILPSPLRFPQITTQPANVSACIGDASVSFSVAATSATDITYQWDISTDGGVTWLPIAEAGVYSGTATASLNISAPTVAMSTNQFRCLLTNIDGTTTSNTTTLTVNDCFISGNLNYNNVALDPLAGFIVSVNGKTATTDALGAFTIPAVTSGTNPVTITAPVVLAPGGINATDAGTVNAWLNTPAAIPAVKYLAGDVDMLSLSNLDAPAIQQNFVAGAAFVQAPWVFYNTPVTTATIPQTFAVTVSGAPVTGFNILGMATGDFNGSFNPNVVGGVSSVVLTPTGLAIKVPAGAPFDLPLVAAANMQVGAISLILNVPAALVTVNGVTVPGATGGQISFSHNTVTNQLKIAWNSTTPVTVLPGQPLVLINMTPTAAFTSTQTLRVSLVASYLNELADALFNPIINASLTVDNVQVSAKVTTAVNILLSASPNPATATTNITFTIPVDGQVRLDIYNNQGTLVMPIVGSGVAGVANTATTISNVNVASLIKGNYYLRLTLLSPGLPAQTTAIKFTKK